MRPTKAARDRIDTLRDMEPEDPWADKFYAALAALWEVIEGFEIPAMSTAPHVVMAQLIEDVAWGRRREQLDLPEFPQTPLGGPRCAICLLPVPDRTYVPLDRCGDACIRGIDTTTMGEKPSWGHIHWRCQCGYVWATRTALQSGRDPERQ